MMTLTVQIGGNILPGACIPELDAHGLTGPGLAQPELEPDEGLGTTPGGQVELFHENSIACVAVIMAVMRG
jgi:hypothetical protein